MRRTGRSTWAGSRARLCGLGVVAALLLSGCTADWPMFRGGPERLGSSSDSTISEMAVRSYLSLAERWHASYRSASPSTSNAEPAVVAGVVYVQSGDGKLHAFDATSGAPKWTVDAGGALAADRKSGSSPAVVGGVVYIGGHDGNLYALDAATGARLWTGRTGATIESSPAVANGVVYITADDFKLYAFDAAGIANCATTLTTKTCAPLWTTDPTDPQSDPPRVDAFAGSSPTVAHGRVYVAGVTITPPEAVIDVFDAGGCGAPRCQPVRVLQTFDYQLGHFGTPIVANGQVFATSSANNYGGNSLVWAWDEASGARRWWGSPRQNDRHANTSNPAVANGFIYWANGFVGMQAFDIDTCPTHDFTTFCQAAWTAPSVLTNTYGATASPAVANGVVYTGNLGVVPGTDQLSALIAAPNLENGCYGVAKVCDPIAGVASEGAANAQVAVANGMIYVAAADTLHVFGLEQIPPTTSVALPANGSVVSGAGAPVWASAADNAAVAKVEFHLTGGTLHDALISTASLGGWGAWTSFWDTTAVPNGTYTLNSVATDFAGNTGRSADVTITVQN